MKKNIIPALLLLAALCAACSSDNVVAEVPQPTEPETVTTPVTIRASYGDGTTAPAGTDGESVTRTAYSESGSTISATWEEDDEILVIFDGHVNTLTLTDGAGTASATFSGSIQGSPKAGSLLACYVRDKNNPGALSVDGDGDLILSDDAFLLQDGSLAGAARCNTYSGSTTYGDGTDLHVAFSVNTSILKFSIMNPYRVFNPEGTKDVTLTYKSGETELARASFTVETNIKSTVYMSVPARLFTGEQTLVYKSGDVEVIRTLSASQADFKSGQTYSRDLNFNEHDIDHFILFSGSYTAQDGDIIAGTGTLNIPDGATVTLRGVSNNVNLQGDATIILAEGTSNYSKHSNAAGIYVPSGKTLTIRGSGSLEAIGGDRCAGIGGNSNNTSCGNIVIEGGNITAIGYQGSQGNSSGAGIGSGHSNNSCGNITITGGTIKAEGGIGSAGIGCGIGSPCGNITITGGTVTAIGGKASAGIGGGDIAGGIPTSCGDIIISGGSGSAKKADYSAPYCVGKGNNGTCGRIIIGYGYILYNGSTFMNSYFESLLAGTFTEPLIFTWPCRDAPPKK